MSEQIPSKNILPVTQWLEQSAWGDTGVAEDFFVLSSIWFSGWFVVVCASLSFEEGLERGWSEDGWG